MTNLKHSVVYILFLIITRKKNYYKIQVLILD
jgi:hypothetical protein